MLNMLPRAECCFHVILRSVATKNLYRDQRLRGKRSFAHAQDDMNAKS